MVARIFLRMGQRQRQRVGGVRRGRFGQVQQTLDHFGDGGFLRRAVADDGLFHLARGDFKNFQAGFGDGGQRRAARFTHDDGGLQVLRVEKPFDDADGRLVLLQNLAQRLHNFDQAAGVFPVWRAGNRPMAEGERVRFGQRMTP